MGTLASLFTGATPPSTTTYNQSSTQTPQWLQDSAQSLVGQAQSVAGQPYQQYQGPQVAPWTPDQLQAQSQVEGMQGSYNPQLQQAGTLATMASNPAQFQQAGQYIPQAASTIQGALTPGASQMNPYINNVTQQAEDQASQYFSNTLQPQINNQFTAAGQFGSSANQRAQDLTGQQITQNLQDTAQSGLAAGYANAQQTGLAGGAALGNLAQLQGGLGYEQGMLGLQGSGQLSNLASTGQNLGLQDAGTLYNMGTAQQQQGQTNLNTAYQNFENQTYYPQSQLSWLQGVMTGQPSNTGTTTSGTQAGYLPGAQYGASPINQATSIYGGLQGLAGTGVI